jgi:hypothetical protein
MWSVFPPEPNFCTFFSSSDPSSRQRHSVIQLRTDKLPADLRERFKITERNQMAFYVSSVHTNLLPSFHSCSQTNKTEVCFLLLPEILHTNLTVLLINNFVILCFLLKGFGRRWQHNMPSFFLPSGDHTMNYVKIVLLLPSEVACCSRQSYRETDSRSDGQYLLRNSCNPRVHCSIHKSPLHVPLNQMNPIITQISCILISTFYLCLSHLGLCKLLGLQELP